MFDHKHYVPILKWRQAEQQSLQDLDRSVKSIITPLIEIPQIPWDYINDKTAKTITQHLSKVPEQLLKSWGTSDVIFFDMVLVPPEERMPGGRHPLKFIFDESRAKGVKLIPVTGPTRDDAYQAAVKEAAIADRRGICLRLREEDFDDEDIEIMLRDTLDILGIRHPYPSVDIVLDFADIASENLRRFSRYVIETIREIERIGRWRTLTFAASSFPRDLSVIPSNSIETLARKEWEVWRALISSGMPRKPSFGDYAIQYPEPSEIDPRIMMMSASIRYTLANEWLILKARSVRRHGSEQYYNICEALVSDPRFLGETFSWGDDYIAKCARKETGPGNATTWRRVGTSHHISLVCQQISSVP